MTRKRSKRIFQGRALRPQSSERRTAELDIRTYDTGERPGSGREFLKMRQWFGLVDEVR
jgi:hypothetical protein